MAETSRELFKRARNTLAGGVSHESRYKNPFPKYISRAEGSRKWEVDGTEYVDYSTGAPTARSRAADHSL